MKLYKIILIVQFIALLFLITAMFSSAFNLTIKEAEFSTNLDFSRKTAKDHTIDFSKFRQTHCSIYQRYLCSWKYEYYYAKSQIIYMFSKFVHYVKEQIFIRNVSTLTWSRPQEFDQCNDENLILTCKLNSAQRINQIILLIQSKQRNNARLIHQEWIGESSRIGFNTLQMLKQHAQQWDQLLSNWFSSTRPLPDYCPNINMNRKFTQLFIRHNYKMLKLRTDTLYMEHYKAITLISSYSHINSPSYYNTRSIQASYFQQLIDYLKSMRSLTLYKTQKKMYQNLNYIKSEIEWIAYQSYTAIKEERFHDGDEQKHMEKEMITLFAKHFAEVAWIVRKQWIEAPAETQTKFNLGQAVVDFFWSVWAWILELFDICLEKANEMQKAMLSDLILLF